MIRLICSTIPKSFVQSKHNQFFNYSNIDEFKLNQTQFQQMENEKSLAQKMIESNEEFRLQFDPSSGVHHGGLQTVVPTGGNRIPTSMPTVYPEGFDPTKPEEVIDYGEEYRSVEANRAIYQNLKKELAKIGPIVEAFLRHQQNFKQKGDPTNQTHKQVLQANIAKQTENLKALQELLETFIPTIYEIDGQGKECAQQLIKIIFESGKKHSNKQELTDFNFKVKRLSTKIFSIAQKCLQRLKDIKKQYAKKPKIVEQKKQEATS